MPSGEIEVHYAALMVSLVRAGELEAAQALREWWEDNFDYEFDPIEQAEEEIEDA